MSWIAYRNKYGSLNNNQRLHQEFALLSLRLCSALGVTKLKMEDLLHYPRDLNTNLDYDIDDEDVDSLIASLNVVVKERK